MAKQTIFETIHEKCGAIDLGAKEIYLTTDGQEVFCFKTFTEDYMKCVYHLKADGVDCVAMEATGVYWIALYCMLEDNGIRVSLVNPRETKQIKGRKTDVKDCRWIYKLFSAGILRESFIPEGRYMEIRQLVRERIDIIEMGGTYVNKMQKCLELMNIKLKQVISQIHGASGMKMIKAIIDGKRDKEYLLGLCERRIKENKSEEILKALEGNFNDTYIFMLKQNMQMWEQHQQQVSIIDNEIEKLLLQLCQYKPVVEVTSKKKPIRHHAPQIENLQEIMVQLFGANLTCISGLNDYTLLRLIGETGVDMSRFPSAGHYASWCGLTPKSHQSGKMRKRVKGTACNKSGQIFKECAQALLNSKDIAIGHFMKRMKARKDSGVVIKAGARKLATAFYNCLTKGIDYVEQGTKLYEEQLKQREIVSLNRLAKKHGLQLVENKIV